ncbi:protein amnionless-like [Macrosteles quadrilineatus]|uniref:protein amnionless-like n=1 Tax=Macrosteles quadrilineatus TaxID=74068 RepID=UPI0023E0A0A4|nr:protein amnionless-like [Macrosteles quadrilineatus]
MTVLYSFIFLLFALKTLEVQCVVRTWQTNLNLNNPNNWSPHRLPCPADRMILQSSAPLVLQLPEQQTSVSGMVLGDDVELVLLKDGSVHLTPANRTAKCSGQDVIFKHTQPMRWVDPSNWDRWTRATPDLERVPCTQEDVKFTPGSTFNIITPPTLKLGSLEINGVMIDSFDWYEHSSQDESSWQLHKPDGDAPDLVISATNCQEDTWCECHNEYLHSEICTDVCPLPLCKQPVKPSGFCCHICGAYFLMRSKDQKKLPLTKVISFFMKNKDIAWHASKVGDLIQIVLLENGDYSGEISAIADDLKTLIEKNVVGWRVEKLFVSGHIWYPISFAQVAVHFLSLMVFAAITIAGIVVFYSKNW